MSDPEPMTSLSRFLRGYFRTFDRSHGVLYHNFNLSGKKRSNGGRRSFFCCHRSTLWEAVLTSLDLITGSENQVMPNSRISSNTRNRPRCVIDRRLVARTILAKAKQGRGASSLRAIPAADARSDRNGRECRRGTQAPKAQARRRAYTKNPLVTKATSGRIARQLDQAALDLATCVAIASINAGDRQS